MFNKLLLILLLFYPLSGYCEKKIIDINPGPNLIDLNNDGTQDIVFKGLYDNSTSHPDTSYTFYIKNNKGNFLHVPIGTDIQNITFWDEKVSGFGYIFRDLRLIRHQQSIKLIIATKTQLNNFEKSFITLIYYQLIKTPEVPGQTPFRWVEYKSVTTKQQYQSVESAFNEVEEIVL